MPTAYDDEFPETGYRSWACWLERKAATKNGKAVFSGSKEWRERHHLTGPVGHPSKRECVEVEVADRQERR